MAAKDTLAFVKVNDGSTWEGIQVVVEQTTVGTSKYAFNTCNDRHLTYLSYQDGLTLKMSRSPPLSTLWASSLTRLARASVYGSNKIAIIKSNLGYYKLFISFMVG